MKALGRRARLKCRLPPRGPSFLLSASPGHGGPRHKPLGQDPGRDSRSGRLHRLVSRSLSSRERGCARGPEQIRIATARQGLRIDALDIHRGLLPVKTYPVSAGIKGGLAGSVAMAFLACVYGVLKPGSIWYPINLLAAIVYAESLSSDRTAEIVSPGQLRILVVFIHLLSALVGLLYGAMLPMFRAVRLFSAGCSALSCGRDSSTACWTCSIHCLPAH